MHQVFQGEPGTGFDLAGLKVMKSREDPIIKGADYQCVRCPRTKWFVTCKQNKF